jgi:DNA helicase-2/ATP-dependent DNA helicase PcrA
MGGFFLDEVRHIDSNIDFDFEDIEIRPFALEALMEQLRESSVDTRDALRDFKPIADKFQMRVIKAQDQTIRMVAPAGSGKTQTIVNRVLSQIKEGMNSNRILVLTFDNAAVSSVKDKLRRELEKLPSYVDEPNVRTLNAFGYWVIREHIPEEYRDVAQSYRCRRLLQEAKNRLREKSHRRFKALPSSIADTFYLDFFSLLKNELFDPRKHDAQAIAEFMQRISQAEVFFRIQWTRIKSRWLFSQLFGCSPCMNGFFGERNYWISMTRSYGRMLS